MHWSVNLPPSSVSSLRFTQLRYFWPNRRNLPAFPILAQVVIIEFGTWIRCVRRLRQNGVFRRRNASIASLARGPPETHQTAGEPGRPFSYSLQS
jgi:hypothetical protein